MEKCGERGLDRVAKTEGNIRNRQKLAASIANARATLKVQEDFGSLDAYLWQFVNGIPKVNAWNKISQIPALTPEAQAMSKALIGRGFKFVGPTICYAFMQAAGLVHDHITV